VANGVEAESYLACPTIHIETKSAMCLCALGQVGMNIGAGQGYRCMPVNIVAGHLVAKPDHSVCPTVSTDRTCECAPGHSAVNLPSGNIYKCFLTAQAHSLVNLGTGYTLCPNTLFAGQSVDTCTDLSPNCAVWATANPMAAGSECVMNPTYMKQNCPKSCGLCTGANAPPPTTGTPTKGGIFRL